jgi:hypothetical protein
MHLIEWDTLEVRVRGERLNSIAAAFIPTQIERLDLRFSNGRLQVSGAVRKFIAVPFTLEIHELPASGMTVRVPVAGASAFGAIPVPRFLFSLFSDKLPRELVRFEEPATFVISLERFLPEFVSADIQRIWIIDGGLAVTLGRGGADLPSRSPEVSS